MKNLSKIVVIGFVFCCLLTTAFAGKPTPAEDLTRCLPEGTVGFIAGSGTDSVGEAFNQTALGKVLGNEQLKESFSALWAQGMAAAEKQGDKEDIEAFRLFAKLARLICRRPVIAGVCENSSGGKVPISGFAIINAGPVRKELADIVKQIEKLDEDGEIIKKMVGPCKMKAVEIHDDQYVYWGFAGTKFVIAACDKEGAILKKIFWPSKDTPEYLSKVPQSGDALVANFDYRAILSLAAKCMKMADSQSRHSQEFEKVMKVYEDLGITSIGNLTARLGFSGADIVADQAVELPFPRKGIYDCYKKVDISIFDLVEPEAMKAGAANFDFPRACNLTIDAYKKILPEKELKMIIQQIETFEEMADVNIREGILDSIAGEGVFYIIPAGAMMQSPSGGLTAIARLKGDGAKFEQSMKALGTFAASKTGGMLQISAIPKGDVTIHAWTVMPLAMMQVMPCWAIVDGNVVFASNAVLCSKAIDRIKSEDPSKHSLRSTAAFKTAVKDVPEGLISLVYTDSKVQFQQITMQAQRLWPAVSMGLMQQGIKVPAMLPNFDEALKDLKPAASYGWLDKDGIYSHYQGSGVEIGTVAAVSMTAAIVMPAMAKTKKLSTRLVSGTNLKCIANALNVYAFDYQDKYPPNLELLIKEADLSPKSLVSPQKPKHFKGPSYIYIPGQSGASNPANIIIYENPEYQHDGTNVLYADGHVEYVKRFKFIKDLKATYKHLGKEAPEVKFQRDFQIEIREHKHDKDFHDQMEKSQEKIKKQLEQQHKIKKVNPKKPGPKKVKHKSVAAAIAS